MNLKSKNKIVIFLFCIISAAAFLSCSNETTQTSNTGLTTVSSTDYTASTADEDSGTYNSDDVYSNHTFSNTVAIDLTNLAASLDGGTATDFSSTAFTDLDAVSIESGDNQITITSTSGSEIIYELTGTTTKTLTITSDSLFALYLDDAAISASAGPAVNIQSTAKSFIISASGSANSLSDASSRDDALDQKGAVYSGGTLIFDGDGSLTVNGDYKHGIYSDGYIRIADGTLDVNVSVRDAIRSVNGFIFDDGDLTIKATGTIADDESKGIKVEGDESSAGAGLGYIVINGGTIDITSVSKAITASWDLDDDAATSETTDDPDSDVIINNGVITITTTGESYETATASCSPEGIEGKDQVVINSGYLTINTDDDCINAGNSITINGGYIYARSESNDSIDSNGTLTINGGIIVAIGSDAPESGFDCDNNTFSITGGTLIGLGGASSTPTASATTQNTIVISGDYSSSNEALAIVSSDYKCVFAYVPTESADTIVLSAPGIEDSTTYSLLSGSTISADEIFYDLYIDNLEYENGSTLATFTTSSTVTTIGTTTPGPN